MRISDWSSDVCSSDLMAEVSDQQITMTASGARGVGDEISHYPVGYAGFPNTFVAPDAGHWPVGAAKSKDTMVAGDKMSTDVVERKSGVTGQSASVRVDLGVRRISKKKKPRTK